MLGISEAAESIGFRTQAVQLDYNTLISQACLPAILHWNQHHFVVIYKAKNKKIHVADPAHGLIKLTKEEFLQRWISDSDENNVGNGIALILEPTPSFYNFEEDNTSNSDGNQQNMTFRNVFGYIIPYKRLLFQLFIGLCVASSLQLILPFLTQSVVDVGINTSNLRFVRIILLAQLALFVGRVTTDFIQNKLLIHVSTRINVSILTDFLIKLMKLPVSFFDSKRTGDILQRMNDHQRIESFLTGSSLNALFSILTLAVFSIVLAIFNTSIFTIFVISTILYSFWSVSFLRRRKTLDYKRFNISSREQSATIQIVQGMQEIKLHGMEKQVRWAWERLQAKLFKLNIKGVSINQWQQAGASFINESKNIIITFLSAEAVIGGKMTLGTMLAVQYIIGQLNSPIEQMIGLMQSWQNAKISLDRLNEVHRMEDEEPVHKNLLRELPVMSIKNLTGGSRQGREVNQMGNFHYETMVDPNISNSNSNQVERTSNNDAFGLVLSNVSFTYPGAGNDAILSEINLNISIGKVTAIVGMSGSGKTTLLKLLLKFYEPKVGDIHLGGVSLRNISHSVLRSYFGVVMQESFIFSDTIARNIAVGQEKVDMARLLHASSVANLNDVIESLPLGFNTMIGAEGTGISMGQKQRVLIARAVYRNPAFILFDEATNSLDANNETEILNNLELFFKGRTVIIVAHRLSTVKHADQIIVLHKGRVSEKGTHHDLINLRGEYYSLVKNQLELDS